jgi:hypothetical protein
MILVKESGIDEFLEKFEVDENDEKRIGQIVDEVMSKLRD